MERIILILLFACFTTGMQAQVPGQPEIPPDECDCPTLRVFDNWCDAAAVFVGTAVRSDTSFARNEVGKWDRHNVDHISIGFRVDRVMKGELPGEVTIVTATDGRGCGYNFHPDRKYLVFAHAERGQLGTDRCTSTRSLDEVGQQFSDSLEHLMNGGTYEIAGVDRPQDCQ